MKIVSNVVFGNCYITVALAVLPFQELRIFRKLAWQSCGGPYHQKAHYHWEGVCHQALSCLPASNSCWQLCRGIACLSTGCCWRELMVVLQIEQLILVIKRKFTTVGSFMYSTLRCTATQSIFHRKPAAFFLPYNVGYNKMIWVSSCAVAMVYHLHDTLLYASPP